MRHVAVEVVGDTNYCVSDLEINEAISAATGEHEGLVNVLIVCGPFHSEIGKRKVIYQDGGVVLAVFYRNFCAMFEEDSLNVREMIFVMDNPKITLDEFIAHLSLRIDVWNE